MEPCSLYRVWTATESTTNSILMTELYGLRLLLESLLYGTVFAMSSRCSFDSCPGYFLFLPFTSLNLPSSSGGKQCQARNGTTASAIHLLLTRCLLGLNSQRVAHHGSIDDSWRADRTHTPAPFGGVNFEEHGLRSSCCLKYSV
jgi:hypothetical protein